jgi:hypothetical protein
VFVFVFVTVIDVCLCALMECLVSVHYGDGCVCVR